MSNMNDRKGSPRRDFEDRPSPAIIFMTVVIMINPVFLLMLFAMTGDWFVFCCLFWSLRLATSRNMLRIWA